MSNPEQVLFTDISIRNLKPQNKRRVVWARGLNGLGVRVSKQGTKSFVFKYDVDGQDRWMTFGQYPKMRLAEALQKYGEIIDKIEKGEDPAEDHVRLNKEAQKTLTVRMLGEIYIEKYAKTHKRSWKEDERILKHDVYKPWGARRVTKITRRDVISLLDDIVARGSPVQANRTLAVIRRMFNFGIDRDILKSSPCYRVKPSIKEKSKERYLTLDEVGQFWNTLDTSPLSDNTKNILKLLLLTLQRCSEVVHINEAELNLNAKIWVIPGARTKNEETQLVPLSPPAIEVIEALLKNKNKDGFLFPSNTDPQKTATVAAISRAVARNLDHFGVFKFTPHDFRRTGSTQLGAFKVPRFDREKILNHKDQTIGAVYDIYEYQDEKRAALNLWADIIKHSADKAGAVNQEELRKKLKYQDYF